jgi:hypothetical protein
MGQRAATWSPFDGSRARGAVGAFESSAAAARNGPRLGGRLVL